MLVTGTILKSIMGVEAKIVRCIHQGGISDIYEVFYDKKPYAIRLYKSKYSERYTQETHAFLKSKVGSGPIHKSIEWPCDVLGNINDEYIGGYVMPLLDKEYIPLIDALNSTKGFSSFPIRINAAFHLSVAMRVLHSKGYCYSNLDASKLLVNPKTGEINLSDTNNIIFAGYPLKTVTGWEFTVPEIGKYNCKSNVELDNYAASVLIFMLLLNASPFEGEAYLKSAGQNPKARLFMFSDEGSYNNPVEGIHQHAINVWRFLPEYIKNLFLHDFKQHSSDYLLRYTPASTWMDNLMRLKTHTTLCPNCKNVLFMDEYDEHWCSQCDTKIETSLSLSAKRIDYTIPLVSGNVLFKAQIVPVNLDELSVVPLRISKLKDNLETVLLKNTSSSKLLVNTSGKGLSELPTGYSIRPIEGMKIKFANTEISVVASKKRYDPSDDWVGLIAPLKGDVCPSEDDESDVPIIAPSVVDNCNGHRKCELLKKIRKNIADANGIPYEISECTNKGPCAGTCPYCDAEAADLRKKLEEKAKAGAQVVFPQIDTVGLLDQFDEDVSEGADSDELGGWDVLPW